MAEQNIESKIKHIICEQLGINLETAITNETELTTHLGADSLDMVELTMAFEEAFNIEIPDEDAAKIKTFGDIVTYIENRLQ